MSRKDDLSPDDRRIWTRVAGTVTPFRPRKAQRVESPKSEPPPIPRAPPGPRKQAGPSSPVPSSEAGPPTRRARGVPEAMEPRRHRRLARERDPIEASLDLHGHGRFQAQDVLTAFLVRAQANGYRSVLVVTGQGRRGGAGVIRASIHEWLQSPALRGVVAGFAVAARRHGGEGAVYVSLKRP